MAELLQDGSATDLSSFFHRQRTSEQQNVKTDHLGRSDAKVSASVLLTHFLGTWYR